MATVHHVGIKAELDAKNAQATAEKLHKTIKATKEEAASIPTGGGKTLAAAYKGSTSSNELTQYGQTRAMRPGGTGASARDFAQEAQGLGGLVRLYATYAANVFAVGAAFNALQAAQDTANMVKGLNQLGAASGVALGNLQKQLVAATDGAVSLREAMEATVKASASGMVSKDILRMGEVAKKASQALGVSMPDALSRISRGITKLEPELLDELGIFTRIDPAVQAYAKSVNKTTSELTQFERQMAFANAVLEEGERKFGEIKIDQNPYTKLAAELKNLATQIGDTINVVLGPLVGLLASSPTALLTAVGALSAMIIKQAIPAIGQFKQGIAEAADAKNLKAIEKIQNNNLSTRVKALEQLKRAEDKYADDRIAAQERAEKAIQDLQSKTTETGKKARLDSGVKKMVERNQLTNNYTKEDLDYLDKLQAKNTKYASTYEELARTIRISQAAEAQATIAHREYQKALEEQSKARSQLTTIGRNQREAQQAALASLKQETLANASYVTSVDGVRAAWRQLREEVKRMRSEGTDLSKVFEVQKADGTIETVTQKTGGISKLGAVSLLASGAVGILGTALQGLGGIIGGMLGGLGLLLGVVAMFDMFFGQASKQIEDFKNVTAATQDAVQNLNDNIDRSFRVSGKELFQYKTLEAQATSIINIADSLELMAQKAKTARDAINDNWYEKLVNNIKKIAGADVDQKETESYVSSVQKIGQLANRSINDMQKFRTILAESFGITNIDNAKELERTIAKLDPKKKQAFVKALREMGIEFGTAASKQKEFQDYLQKSTESFKEFQNSFVDKNPLVIYAENAIKGIQGLAEALATKNIEQNFEGIIKLADQIRAGNPLFGAETSIQIVKYADGLGKVQEGLARIREERAKLTEKSNSGDITEKAAKQAFAEEQRKAQLITATSDDIKTAKNTKFIQTLNNSNDLVTLRRAEDALRQTLKNNTFDLETALGEAFDNGSKILSDNIELSLAKGSTAFKQGLLSLAKGPSAVAGSLEASLKNSELSIESQMLQVQRNLLIEAKRTNMLLQISDAEAAKRALTDEEKKGQKGSALDARIGALKKGFDSISGTTSTKAIRGAAIELGSVESGKEGQAAAKAVAYDVMQLAQQLGGLDAKLNSLGQQMRLNTVQGIIKDIEGKFEIQIETIASSLKSVTTEIDNLKLAVEKDQTLTFVNDQLILEAETRKVNLELEQKRLDLQKEGEVLARLIREGLPTTRATEMANDIARKGNALIEEERQKRIQLETTEVSNRKKREEHYELLRELQRDIIANEKEFAQRSASTRLDIDTEILNARKASGAFEFNQRAELEAQAELSRRKIILDTEKQQYDLEKSNHDKIRGLEKKADEAKQIAEKQLHEQEILNILKRGDEEKALIEELKQARLKVIEAEKEARENALRNSIADTLADSIAEAIFEGGKAGMASLKDTIKSAFRESITSALKQNLRGQVGNILSAIVGAFGGSAAAGPSAGAGGVAGGGGVMGTLSSVKTIFTALSEGMSNVIIGPASQAFVDLGVKFGSQTIADIGNGMRQSLSSGNFTAAWEAGGAQAAGAVIGTIMDGVAAVGVQKLISNGYKIGNGKFVDLATAIGGAFLGPIAGLIGGVINRAFGRKLKDVGIEGKFGGEAGFVGKNYEFYKGGWLRRDKTEYSDMDSESQKSFAQQFRNIQLSTMLTAGSLNIANKDNLAAVSNYSKDIKLSTQGLSKEDAIAKVQEEFDKIADDMAKAFLTTTVTTTESVKKMVEETKNMGDDLVTTYREVTEEVTSSTQVLRNDLPSWMQAIVDLEGPTAAALEKIKEYPIQALQQFGIARDALVDTFAEGLMTGKGRQAGQLVANQIVQSIEKQMYTNAAGQIFDIMNQGIMTPILHAALTGQSVQAALSDAAINATIERATQAANALAAIFKDEKFKTLLNTLKDGLGKVLGDLSIDFDPARFQSLPTTFADLDTTAEEASDSVDELTEKLRDLAKASITNLFDDLVSTLKKMGDTVKSNIKKVQDFRKSLIEFKEKLLLGDKQNLTAAEKYNLSKTTFETTLQKALQGDETAIGKLTSASEAFLSESRNFYSSGEQYTQDFNRVLSVLETVDTAAATLEQQLNDELKDINNNLLTLGSIDTTLDSIYVVLEKGLGTVGGELVNLMDKLGINQASVQNLVQNGLATTEQANLLLKAVDKNGNGLFDKEELVHLRNIGANTNLTSTATKVPTADTTAAANAAGISTYGADQIVKVGNENFVYSSAGAIGMQTGTNWTLQLKDGTRVTSDRVAELLKTEGVAMFQAGQHEALYNVFKQAGLSSAIVQTLSGVSQQDLLGWAAANGLPAFATGINYVPYDMPAMIHEGERIFPKADNEELMKSVKGNNNAELVNEIKRLNDKVASLERTVAQGAAVNAQATDRNTEAVVQAVSNSTDRTIQSNNIRERATLK